MTRTQWLHTFFIDGILPEEPFPEASWDRVLRDYADRLSRPLSLPLDVWLSWTRGDTALMAATPPFLPHPDSLFHSQERRLTPEQIDMVREHYRALPDHTIDTLITWIGMMEPYVSSYVLSEMYNSIAQTLAPDDFMALITQCAYKKLTIVPPYRPLSFFTTSEIWHDIWGDLCFERLEWNETFLQYMEPYWDLLPCGLFFVRLQPHQQQALPIVYQESLPLFERDPFSLLAIAPEYADSPYHVTLGTIRRHYGAHSTMTECPLY